MYGFVGGKVIIVNCDAHKKMLIAISRLLRLLSICVLYATVVILKM